MRIHLVLLVFLSVFLEIGCSTADSEVDDRRDHGKSEFEVLTSQEMAELDLQLERESMDDAENMELTNSARIRSIRCRNLPVCAYGAPQVTCKLASGCMKKSCFHKRGKWVPRVQSTARECKQQGGTAWVNWGH